MDPFKYRIKSKTVQLAVDYVLVNLVGRPAFTVISETMH